MAVVTRLIDFFLGEFEAEEASGFARLLRVPDTRVVHKLHFYRSLNARDRRGFRECCAHWAYNRFGFLVDASPIDGEKHPYFELWLGRNMPEYPEEFGMRQSVPIWRATVAQYKMDAYRKVESRISKEEFEFACSIRSIKALELRKRVKAALKPLVNYKLDKFGGGEWEYFCRSEEKEFTVKVDYGGRGAQLRYSVEMALGQSDYQRCELGFETALGFGFGDWDYLVEENIEDAMKLFGEVVAYSVRLPERIRAEVSWKKGLSGC